MRKSHDPNGSTRVLLPIDMTPHSRWGLRYALWRRDNGETLGVMLLHVIEPLLRRWDILRFRPQQEVDRFRTEHAQSILNDAAQTLQGARIPHWAYIREGWVVPTIVDAAEELRCHAIVLPRPASHLWRVFSRDIARKVMRNRSSVPVILVDHSGRPIG